jgi:hypothetical protein
MCVVVGGGWWWLHAPWPSIHAPSPLRMHTPQPLRTFRRGVCCARKLRPQLCNCILERGYRILHVSNGQQLRQNGGNNLLAKTKHQANSIKKSEEIRCPADDVLVTLANCCGTGETSADKGVRWGGVRWPGSALGGWADALVRVCCTTIMKFPGMCSAPCECPPQDQGWAGRSRVGHPRTLGQQQQQQRCGAMATAPQGHRAGTSKQLAQKSTSAQTDHTAPPPQTQSEGNTLPDTLAYSAHSAHSASRGNICKHMAIQMEGARSEGGRGWGRE